MANSNNFTQEILRYLKDYTDDVKDEVKKASKEIAKESAQKLKTSSPKKSGKYRKGWTSKKVNEVQVVHNKTRYQLTHLLEKGHASRNGGRVGAIVHIKPVEENAIREFERRIEEAVGGGR